MVAIASATTAITIGATSLPPDVSSFIAPATATRDRHGEDKQAAGRKEPGVHVLAAQKTTANPAYWLLIGPTLLALAALGVMVFDRRKRLQPPKPANASTSQESHEK
jgi:hypothetical protein